MTRKILHLDLDAFFCSVEEHHSPTLRGIAFAVGGRPDERGVVASCSYAARRYGIHSAMPMSQAVKLHPKLVIVPPHRKLYQESSRQVMAILHELTPLVEQISIDEAFLDVSSLPDPAETLARRLQHTINTKLNLPCSLGVATNKLVAKIANNVGKSIVQKDAPPNAIKVVLPGEESTFLAPLSTRELWGVGPKTAESLAKLGIHTIGDIARWPEADLAKRFGKPGQDLARRSHGVDDRPVETERETKSISRETTFTRDVRDRETLRRTLHKLAEGVALQTRQEGLSGDTIKLKLRWANFKTVTRQATLNGPTNQDIEIYSAVLQLFDKAWPSGTPVRLIGVGVSGFESQERQLNLFTDIPDPEPELLQNTLDALRDKFGTQIIRRGSTVKRKLPGE
jgi:DNA polymerase-4